MGKVYPDCTLFFDVDPEIALSRKFINREGDRLEKEDGDFHKKTYLSRFLTLVLRHKPKEY